MTRGRSISSHLGLVRGAALSGNVLYEDGTPVQDAVVKVLRGKGANGAKPIRPEEISMLSPFLFDDPGHTTDDRGHFRIAGLSEGDYSIQVILRNPKRISYKNPDSFVDDSGTQFMLTVYLGDSLQWSQASVIHVDASEERGGVDINVPLDGFRTFAGYITSVLDQHTISHAVLLLHSSNDPSFERRASLHSYPRRASVPIDSISTVPRSPLA